MPKSRGGSHRDERATAAGQPVEDENQVVGPGLTGSYLVLFAEGGEGVRAGAETLRRVAGLQVAHSRDFEKKPLMSAFEGADTLVFDELGVAVSDTPPDQVQALSGVESASGVLAVEPERIVYALNDEPRIPTIMPGIPTLATGVSEAWSLDYLRGYREAVNQLIGRLLGEPAEGMPELVAEPAPTLSEAELTWGLQVVFASDRAGYQGRGSGHRPGPPAPGLRHTGDPVAKLRPRPDGAGRSWSRHALHRHELRAGSAATPAPLRGGAERRDLRRQGVEQPG